LVATFRVVGAPAPIVDEFDVVVTELEALGAATL